jgi:DNA-binding HxlR family transcriptional regulator
MVRQNQDGSKGFLGSWSDLMAIRPTTDTARCGPCAQWRDGDGPLIREILNRVGDKWSILVIGTLSTTPMRYSDLHAAIPGLSQRMLTLTLRQLQRDGLVDRVAYAEVPPRVEYSLTPLGETLLDTVSSLAQWALDHRDEIETNRASFDAATG